MDILIEQAAKILPPGQLLMLIAIGVVIKLLWEQGRNTESILKTIVKLETWRDEHEKANEKAFDANADDHRDLWKTINHRED